MYVHKLHLSCGAWTHNLDIQSPMLNPLSQLSASPHHISVTTLQITNDFIVGASEDFSVFVFFDFSVWNFWTIETLEKKLCQYYLCCIKKLETY